MRGRVRRGLRVAVAIAIAMTFVLGLATRGGARNADVTATVSIGDATAAVTEGQPASFPVTFDQSATADFRVPYTTSEGLSGFFDVHQGDPTATTISVPTASNTLPEDDRTFTVTLQTPVDIPDDTSSDATTAAIGTATGTGTIIDDDWQIGAIATTPSPPSVPESGAQTIDYQVSLNAAAPPNHAITVDYAVADGSAQNGRDYTVTSPANGNTSGTLTFAPGSSSVDVQVKAKGDGLFGTDRAFTVTFANPQGAGFAGGVPNEQATGAITETDPPPLMGISTCTGSTVNAGDVASFPILLGGAHPATTLPASVDYTAVGDSTVAGDFESTSGTAVIPAGQREFDVKVQTDVHPPAGDRTFHIQLSNPQNVRLSSSSASCTIHSTATGGGGTGQPSIAIADPAPVAAPSSGSVPVSVQLTLTPPTPQPSNPGPVTVHWQTQDGAGAAAATAPADYTAASGDVTWPAGTNGPNPTPITISINANPARTALGTFTVAFTSSDATFVGGGTATITIVPPGSTVPLISIADASAAKHAGSVGVSVHMTPAASGPVISRLRDRRRHERERREGGHELHGEERHAHVRGGRDREDDHDPDPRERARRAEPRLHRQPLQRDRRRHDRERLGHGDDPERRLDQDRPAGAEAEDDPDAEAGGAAAHDAADEHREDALRARADADGHEPRRCEGTRSVQDRLSFDRDSHVHRDRRLRHRRPEEGREEDRDQDHACGGRHVLRPLEQDGHAHGQAQCRRLQAAEDGEADEGESHHLVA